MTKEIETKVLFKYIGGKTWLKDKIKKSMEDILLKNTIDTFIEPFAGGLGCFLNTYELLQKYQVKKVILNDINKKVINFYETVNSKPEDLIREYEIIENDFSKHIPYEYIEQNRVKDKNEIKKLLVDANEFYLGVRKEFNESYHDDAKSAALFLFLQTHCFNGVYRENQKGGYNTPFNWGLKKYNAQKTRDKIMDVHKVFSCFDISFTNKNYKEIDFYNENALYYIDPPYINNEDEIKENKYHKDGFNNDDQLMLINYLKDINFIYSNHNHPLLINELKMISENINIQEVSRKNIMSASNESRKIDKTEILVSHSL